MRRLWVLNLILMMGISSCGSPEAYQIVSESGDSAYDYPGALDPGVRYIFHRDYFTDLEDFLTYRATRYQCLGDALYAFKTEGGDYSGGASFHQVSDYGDYFTPTYHPDFIRNVSVDMTRTYFADTLRDVLQIDQCSLRDQNHAPSPCADFDPGPGGVTTVAPTPTVTPTPVVYPTPTPVSTPVSPAYLNDGKFYRVRDPWCAGQGVIDATDPETSKAYVGGVSIDLNRARLGASEDLLLVLTYQAFSEGDGWPYPAPATYAELDRSQIQVKMVGTQLGLDQLLGAKQPRSWQEANFTNPTFLKVIATFSDPFSSLRSEQVLVPLSQNPLVDRIRIERIRGSFHLYQADLYRLGNRAE